MKKKIHFINVFMILMVLSITVKATDPLVAGSQDVDHDCLERFKGGTESQTPQEIATAIDGLYIAKAAKFLSHPTMLEQSGQIWMSLGEAKAAAIWHEIQRQDMYDEFGQQRSRKEWDSNLLKTRELWNNATVKHFRHWIRYNTDNIEKHVNSNNFNEFLTAIIGNVAVKTLKLSGKDLRILPTIFQQLPQLSRLRLNDNSIEDIRALSTLTQLTVLELSDNIIEDITALSGLTQLIGLGLHHNKIKDIRALSTLTQLTELELSDNIIEDITALSGLTQLIGLGLHHNKIKDITALGDLIKLTILCLNDNSIEDITALGNLIQLTKLYLNNNSIEDITALSTHTLLTELALSRNEIKDITALSPLIKLTILYLNNNIIEDITALGNLTQLTKLYLNNNSIEDIGALSGPTQLTELTLYHNEIKDITAIGNLIQLTKLYLNNNSIEDIGALSALTQLTELGLSNNSIEVIGALSGLTLLTELGLQHNKIKDITAIGNLIQLTKLWLNDNSIEVIGALSGLTQLTKLWLNDNSIEVIGALSGFTQLTELGLHHNKIKDITALGNFIQLTKLYLYNNSIEDIGALSPLTQLTELALYHNKIKDITALGNLTQLTKLWLNDNSIEDITALSTLTQLTILWLHHNEIKDITALSTLTQLTILWLHHNEIKDITALSPLTQLTELALYRNKLQKFPKFLLQFKNIKNLLAGNSLDKNSSITQDEIIEAYKDPLSLSYPKERMAFALLFHPKLRGLTFKLLYESGKYLPQIKTKELKLHNPNALKPLGHTAKDIIQYFTNYIYGKDGRQGYMTRRADRAKDEKLPPLTIETSTCFLERYKVTHSTEFSLGELDIAFRKLCVILNQDDKSPIPVSSESLWVFQDADQKQGLRAVLHHIYQKLLENVITKERLDTELIPFIEQMQKCPTAQMNAITQFAKILGINLKSGTENIFWRSLCKFKAIQAQTAINLLLEGDDTTHKEAYYQEFFDKIIGLPILMENYSDRIYIGDVDNQILWESFSALFNFETITGYMVEYFNPILHKNPPKPVDFYVTQFPKTRDEYREIIRKYEREKADYEAEKIRINNLGKERRLRLRSIPQLAKMFYQNATFKSYAFAGDEISMDDIYSGELTVTPKELMLYIKIFIGHDSAFTDEERAVRDSGHEQVELSSLMERLPILSGEYLSEIQKFYHENINLKSCNAQKEILKFMIDKPPFVLNPSQKTALHEILEQQYKVPPVTGDQKQLTLAQLISESYFELVCMSSMDGKPAQLGALSYSETLQKDEIIKQLESIHGLIQNIKISDKDRESLQKLKCYRIFRVIVTLLIINKYNTKAKTLVRKVIDKVKESKGKEDIIQIVLENIKILFPAYGYDIEKLNQEIFKHVAMFYVMDHPSQAKAIVTTQFRIFPYSPHSARRRRQAPSIQMIANLPGRENAGGMKSLLHLWQGSKTEFQSSPSSARQRRYFIPPSGSERRLQPSKR